jgi:DNA gyrase subunit A
MENRRATVEIGTVRQVDINHEMQGAYLDYAMSVIVARALPDVRDGLKPVHRRILWAMHDMHMTPDKPYRKSARIVGEVLGKYHPHGDAAVYDSMVRMAQDFSMRYTLVDGQGNFGSIDGDQAAAMRYTEARMDQIAVEMLADIEKETVAFGPNFDGTLDEPLVLPSALPNFLVNGASGIAVGMATNVPPHNLGEIVDALCYMIDRYDGLDEVTVEDLMRFVKGPDFPTGGILYRYGDGASDEEGRNDVIQAAYAVGRGRFVVQARAHIEEMSRNRSRIVVTELPYQVNKTRLIERIADLVRMGRLEGITDLRDESDRQGMRLVIELTRTIEPEAILADLFKLTPMRSTFGVNMLALVDGEPRTLSLKRALWHYLAHRQEIVERRTAYDLERARRQAHILEGLLIALDNLDEVIQTIRRSRDTETAKGNLIKKFKLTEIQAQAILDMPLRRLAALEQRKIREEYKEKLALIAFLEDLLGDPHKILAVIRQELVDLKTKYGDQRRTQIVERTTQAMATARDLVVEEDVIIVASAGKIWREPLVERRRGTALGLDRGGLSLAVTARTTGEVALFTADGLGALVSVHHVPEAGAACTLGELINSNVSATPVAAVFVPAEKRDVEDAGYVFFAAASGKVKRVSLSDLHALASRGLSTVMGIESPDRLLAAWLTEGSEDIVLMTSAGQAIRFAQDEVRPMGLPAAGVAGIKLGPHDEVVGGGLARDKSEVVVVMEHGHAKRTPVDEFPTQKRYGGGVVAGKITARVGKVAGGCVVKSKDEFFVVTEKGRVTGSTLTSVPALKRPAQGQSFINVERDRVVGVVVTEHPTTTISRKPTPEEPSETPPTPPARSRPKKATAMEGGAKPAPAGKAKTTRSKSSRERGDSDEVVQLALDVDLADEAPAGKKSTARRSTKTLARSEKKPTASEKPAATPARKKATADAPPARKRSGAKKGEATAEKPPATKPSGKKDISGTSPTRTRSAPTEDADTKPATKKSKAAGTGASKDATPTEGTRDRKTPVAKATASPPKPESQKPATKRTPKRGAASEGASAEELPGKTRVKTPPTTTRRSRVVTSVPKKEPTRKK